MSAEWDMAECARCDGSGIEPGCGKYAPECTDCMGRGNTIRDVACGWAFDCGVREAESEEAGGVAFDWMLKYRDASRALEWEVQRAVAAERERCAATHAETREALVHALQFWRWTVPSPQAEPPWVIVARRVESEILGAPAPREG